MADPRPGFFILRDAVQPAFPPGRYRLTSTQELIADGGRIDTEPIAPCETTLEITCPRFVLPPAEVLSTYPPNQSAGAFSTRLPQIVLRRRTLPWERSFASRPRPTTPWLALVVLADGEASFLDQVPIARCVTPGVELSGRMDAEIGSAVVVRASMVRRIFPARDELHLLSHVRQVDRSDTELALGDDDGWMAVVLSNRLPQPGVRYRACLISVDGQIDALPDSEEIDTEPSFPLLAPILVPLDRPATAKADMAKGAAATSPKDRDAWSDPAAAEVEPSDPAAAPVSDRTEVDGPDDPDLTFPVLASWTFTCTDAGDFQSRMQGLQVGLLGTLSPPPLAAPPRTRPLAEVLPTGHIGMDAVARDGVAERCWYRGPCVPAPVRRTPRDAEGRLPLRHTSDHGRVIGADGREQIGLAVAFEIGRLLALAEPSVVAAFHRWRAERFEVSRRRALLLHDDALGTLRLAEEALLGHRSARELLVGLGAPDAIWPVRGLVDPIDDPLFTDPMVAGPAILDRMGLQHLAREGAPFEAPGWTLEDLAGQPARLGGAAARAGDLHRNLTELTRVIDAARLEGGA